MEIVVGKWHAIPLHLAFTLWNPEEPQILMEVKMSQFVFKKQVAAYTAIARFGKMAGEQFELRLQSDAAEWLAFLNFRHSAANPVASHRNTQGIPELFIPPEQYHGVLDMLRHEQRVWFTLYENPLAGYLSISSAPVGRDVQTDL